MRIMHCEACYLGIRLIMVRRRKPFTDAQLMVLVTTYLLELVRSWQPSDTPVLTRQLSYKTAGKEARPTIKEALIFNFVLVKS